MQLAIILSCGLVLAVLVNTFGLVSGTIYLGKVEIDAKPGKIAEAKVRYPNVGTTNEITKFSLKDSLKEIQNYTVLGGGVGSKFIQFSAKSYVSKGLHFYYEIVTKD